MKLFSQLTKIKYSPDLFQLLYALFVIVLVPVAIAFNTLFLLRNSQKDMDYELNNKAQLVVTIISRAVSEHLNDRDELEKELAKYTRDAAEIKAIEVFTSEKESPISFTTTSEFTKSVSDPVLNQLAWGTGQTFSKQIHASVDSGLKERMWVVAAPIFDSQKNKLAVINLYISASQIDALSGRTVFYSMIILVITIIIILLLLLNHFSFFEQSILLKKLKEVDKLKDDFISIASHELKTPLTVIANYSYLLWQKQALISTDEKAKTYIERILETAKRLKTLVEDILDVSRIEQKRINLNLADEDLRVVIQEVVGEFSPQAAEKGLQLVYNPPAQPIVVYCDKDKMKQIFLNLIGNALKYTLSGSVAIYHGFEQKGKIRTFVKDTGTGMSAEGLKKLFSKFTRLYNEKTKDVPGTGLGLWLTKNLVEMMNGTISAQSIENEGSQFEVSFPLKNSSLRGA